MPQAVVVSNTESLRTQYFIKAGETLGVDTRFITYDMLLQQPAEYTNTLIKLEPPQYETTDFIEYQKLNGEYIALLNQLDELTVTHGWQWINLPKTLLNSLDKLTCKQLLNNKVRSTPLLPENISSFDELVCLLHQHPIKAVFIKPRWGAGAGGVIALRMNMRTEALIAYTSLKFNGEKACNTKRIEKLTNPKTIARLVNLVISYGAVVEEWIPKDTLENESYDLRVACQFGKTEHIVVRCSQLPITNLHLNNNAKPVGELALTKECFEEINELCVKATSILGLTYAGIDVLIAKGTQTPYVIEVNGQGDHIYHDMFNENNIYKNQLRFFL